MSAGIYPPYDDYSEAAIPSRFFIYATPDGVAKLAVAREELHQIDKDARGWAPVTIPARSPHHGTQPLAPDEPAEWILIGSTSRMPDRRDQEKLFAQWLRARA